MFSILNLTQKSGSSYCVIFTIINRLNIEHACVLNVLIKKLVHCYVGYWRWVKISDQRFFTEYRSFIFDSESRADKYIIL